MDLDVFRKNFLNIILILFVIIIILVVYGFLTNPQESIEVFSPDEIMENSEDYLNQLITVEGYYYNDNRPTGEGVISRTIREEGSSTTIIIITLPVDHSNVNTSGILIDKIKYRFTGTLVEKQSEYGTIIILVADKIEAV